MKATAALLVVGVDLAKTVFQLPIGCGLASRRTPAPDPHRVERWFANRAVGLVVMEACGSAHHWARGSRG